MYQRYEAGRIPSPEHLSIIADRCNVTVDWLLGRSGTPRAAGIPESANAGGFRYPSRPDQLHAAGYTESANAGGFRITSPPGAADGHGSKPASSAPVARDPIDPYVCRYPSQIPPECRDLSARITGVERQLDQIREVLISLVAQERAGGAAAPDKRAAG